MTTVDDALAGSVECRGQFGAIEWLFDTPHPTGGYDRVYETPKRVHDPNWTTARTRTYQREYAPHRVNGPAVEEFDDDGSVLAERWMVDGRLHRDGAPASIRRSVDGSVYSEEYFIRGELHREDGPAQRFFSDSESFGAAYFRRGKFHRVEGPALADVSNGVESDVRFYVDDVELTAEEFDRFREAYESGAPEAWAIAYAKGDAS